LSSKNKLPDKIFYGWVIVASIIASSFIMMGINSSFGVFFKSLGEAYKLTRASTSSILSVRMVFSAVSALIAGWAIDRLGPRKVFSVMGIFIGLSLILTGMTSAAWQIFITYSLLISIGSGAVYVVVTATILRWFDRKRGLALGITGAGGGIGTAVIAPIAASLITGLGWRDTMILLGLFAWLVMIPASQLLKKDPREVGDYPDGEIPENTNTDSLTSDIKFGSSILRLLRTRNFWAILFIWLTMAFSTFFIMTHIVPHARDTGFSRVEAATILSFSGIAMIAGRLFAGIISQRVNAKAIAILSSLVQSGAIFFLIWGKQLWILYCIGAVHGFTFGSFGTSVTLLIGRTFDLNVIGKILGILEIGIFIGGAIGPYLGGFIFDTTGSYTLAFMIMGAAGFLRMILVMLVRPKL